MENKHFFDFLKEIFSFPSVPPILMPLNRQKHTGSAPSMRPIYWSPNQETDEVKSWSWLKKLSPFEMSWRCYEDCRMQGCPGHTLKCRLSSAVDIIHIDFGDGTEIYLDPVKMALILHIAKKFNPYPD